MLAKHHKLNTQSFNHVFKKGKRSFSETFQYISLPSPQFRCAVVVSKKHAKNATTRNSLRRQIFNILRSLYTQEKLPNIDVIIMIKKNKVLKKHNELHNELQKHLYTVLHS